MKRTNIAVPTDKSEQSLSVEKLDNGHYRMEAVEESFGKSSRSKKITMIFSKKGFDLLLQTMTSAKGMSRDASKNIQ